MIRSLDSIRAHARQSLEDFDARGIKPVNPCPPETDAHTEWAASFYEECLAREMVEQ